MVAISMARRSPFAMPASGSKALAYGNSISDISIDLGHWLDIVAARQGWVIVGRNPVANGDAETNVANWTTIAGTLARDTGTVAGTGGTASFKLTSTGVQPFTSPFNPTSGDVAGDSAHGNTLGIYPGYWYRASCLMRVPTGNAANSGWLYVEWNDGSAHDSTVATCAADSTWRTINTGWFQVSATATQSYLRVQSSDATNTRFINFDNVMLERAAANMTAFSLPLPPYVAHANRAAISGSILQTNDATANNGANTTNRAARLDAYAPDIVFLLYNENDLYYTTGAGATTPTTLATWRTALNSVIQAIRTNLPNARIVVLGCSRTTFGFQGAIATGTASVTITNGGNYTVAPTGVVFSGTTGGTGAAGTVNFAGSAVTSVNVTAGGVGYHTGDAVTFTGGTFTVAATGTVATLTNAIPPFSAVDLDDAARQMDNVARQECRNAGGLFVPLRSLMTDDLVQTPANVAGKHPSVPGGMQQIASIVLAALDGGM